MKTLTTLFSCLLGTLLFSTIAFGQPPTSADQSNYPAVAQSISDQFGTTIAATTAEIESFLQAALVGTGPGCGYPDAIVESYDANSITFEWHPVANGVQYVIQYMDLQNASNTGLHPFNQSPNDLYTYAGLSDGLYLFTLQTLCSNGMRSAIGIIIADKDVMISINNRISCKCRRQGPGMSINSGFTFPEDAEFELTVTLPEDGEIRLHGISEEADAGGNIPVTINPDCGEIVSSWNNVIYPTITDGAITFAEGSIWYYFGSGDSFIYYLCDRPTGQHGDPRSVEGTSTKFEALQLSPNPVQDRLELRVSISEPQPIRVELFDAQGQLMQTLWQQDLVDPGPVVHFMPTSTLSSGIYFCRVQIGNETTMRKLIKH